MLQLCLDDPFIAPGAEHVHQNNRFVLEEIHNSRLGRDMHPARKILKPFHLEFEHVPEGLSIRVKQRDIIHPLENIVKIKVFREKVNFWRNDNPVIVTFQGLLGDNDSVFFFSRTTSSFVTL